jgi:hypothetical protein
MSQVSADAVDWGWVTALPTARARVDALLGSEEAEAHVEWCSDIVEGWAAGGVMRFEVGDALDTLIAETDPAEARLLRRAFCGLLSNEDDEAPDELGLAKESGGCFYASVPPKQVADARAALDKIDLAATADQLNPDERDEYEAYLRQWAAVIRRAADRGMGIVAHEG